MSALSLDFEVVKSCTLIGEGRPADQEWTKPQFIALCDFLLNGNGEHDFMHVYRDDQAHPHFAKAKKVLVGSRITWAWDTITGKAKSKIAVGFYPIDNRRMSRWAAVDFDAHEDDAARAHVCR